MPCGWGRSRREKRPRRKDPNFNGLLDQFFECPKTGIRTGPFGSLLKKHEHEDEGVSVIGIENIGPMTFVPGSKIHITVEKSAELVDYSLFPGDLVISRSGTVGEVCVLPPDLKDARMSTNLMRIRLHSQGVLPDYLCLLLHGSPFVRRQIHALCSGSTRDFLNTEILLSLVFPIPPADEQATILLQVAEKLSQIEASDCAIFNALRRADRLRKSILKKAFEGRLVPQDFGDESAAALLMRNRPAEPSDIAHTHVEANTSIPRKRRDSIFFRRAAIVTYIVNHLSNGSSCGRTKLEKVLHLAQSHLSLPLDLEFKRHAAGPFDEVVYKLEYFAKKHGWFETRIRKSQGVSYGPGPKSADMVARAIRYLDDQKEAFDQLLRHAARMNAEQAELFATTYAAWNDLLIDGRLARNETIAAEIYAWHPSKAKFDRSRIDRCIAWMRERQYVPQGKGRRTGLIVRPSRPRQNRAKPS